MKFTEAPRHSSDSSTPATNTASRCCSTWSATTSAPLEITSANLAHTSPTCTTRPGETPSTLKTQAVMKSAASSATTPSCGSAIITSTACASTPYTPTWTAPPSTSWSNSQLRSAHLKPKPASTTSSSPKAISTIQDLCKPQKQADTAWTRNGATTSTTRSSPCLPATAAATTPTSAPSPILPNLSNQSSSTTESTRHTATAFKAAPSKGCPHGASSATRRTTIRWAIAQKVNASAASSAQAVQRSPPRSSSPRHLSPCSSRAKSGPQARRSSTSPTTKRS